MFGYWHGAAGAGHNWQSDEMMFSLCHFLAPHAGHRLEVLNEYADFDAERFLGRMPDAADLTGLTAAPEPALLIAAGEDRAFALGRPLSRGGTPHLFARYMAHRDAPRQSRQVWSLLARTQTRGGWLRVLAAGPSWRTEAVVALARGIHADRAFHRLPVLADALEDAGCHDPEVLEHCRGSGPHHRGCWVVDLVRGKT
ncbi:MAG TPA: hypothetical protein VD866_21720 [Urbifossiella sp.]|nr:hypothetical protein [Urbifossiella sp.]